MKLLYNSRSIIIRSKVGIVAEIKESAFWFESNRAIYLQVVQDS
jgi:hypothetical protein